MKIIITSKKIIKKIQEEFAEAFPFLRIEFFIKPTHKSGAAEKISNLLTIGNALHKKDVSEIEIFPCTIVREFEKDFKNKFGIYVQLYRKSGKLWQEITFTDNWTMKQQDEMGNEISSIVTKDIY